jgi:hypothetical protein
VSGRHGRDTPGGQDGPPADSETEAIATAADIATLCRRLIQHPGTLNYPMVVRELRKLEDLITGHFADNGLNPGRHRSAIGAAASKQITDTAGFDFKPNPLTVTTPAEFVAALRQYRAWSGNPSLRTMAQRAEQIVVHSTMHAAMNAEALPRLEVVKAIIIGCDGSEDDLRAFVTAWRRIATGQTLPPRPDTRFHGAPLPAIGLVPAREPEGPSEARQSTGPAPDSDTRVNVVTPA